ncbi:MAG: GreA/GreB family elongation factor [Patescibacteria group bacterium]
MRLPTRKSETERLQNQVVDNHLTPAKIAKMREELTDLVKSKRGPAAEEVARTSQMGDLSENAAYQFAKQNLRRINSRILILQERLNQAIPIDLGPTDGKIRIGSTVMLETNGQTITYEIVGSVESNPARGRISYSSPLGTLLIGKSLHDTITLTTPHANTTYKITNIA